MRRVGRAARTGLACVALAGGCGTGASPAERAPESATPGAAAASVAVEKERADVPEPAPVSHAGTRYEAVLWGRARGLPQNGGYVAAIDERTGAERWLVKVYDALPDDGREQDKLDVFITHLALDADPRFLLVTNERDGVFRLDLQTRAVHVVRR